MYACEIRGRDISAISRRVGAAGVVYDRLVRYRIEVS